MTQLANSPLRFVTSNADKLREASEILARPVEGHPLDLEEIQSADLKAVVSHKVNQAFTLLRQPLFVEDTALSFLAWGGLPGPFVKFFLNQLHPEGLYKALSPFENFEALALCGVGYHDGQKAHYFEGQIAGTIVSPRGDLGFGWDCLFVPKRETRTFAEMSAEEKHLYSMRALALQGLSDHLHSSESS